MGTGAGVARLSGRSSAGRAGAAAAARRRGTTIILALLYLVLFSAIALGFFAQTNLGAQVSVNEEHVLEAQVAAESGLQFLRYQLSCVNIDTTVPREQVFERIYNQLSARMDGTPNMGTQIVGYVPTVGAKAINVPSLPTQYIRLRNNGPQFRAGITELTGGRIRVTSTGRSSAGGVARSIAMDFVESPKRGVMDYGVATRGTLELNSRSAIRGATLASRGKVLSTYTTVSKPIQLNSGGGLAAISGHVHLTHLTGWVNGTGSIAGEANAANWGPYIHPNTAAPDFPVADPQPFIDYLVGRETLITGNNSAAYLANIRIKAGCNPTLSGGGTYEGVILIEAPNQVTFTPGCTINGVIVVANPTETTATNRITFNGPTRFYGTQTLPDSFGSLKTLTGSSIVAPNFQVDFAGATGSTLSGATLVKGLSLSLNSVMTFTMPVMAAGTGLTYLSSDSVIQVAGDPPLTIPAGMRFPHTYAPHPATYLEVSP